MEENEKSEKKIKPTPEHMEEEITLSVGADEEKVSVVDDLLHMMGVKSKNRKLENKKNSNNGLHDRDNDNVRDHNTETEDNILSEIDGQILEVVNKRGARTGQEKTKKLKIIMIIAFLLLLCPVVIYGAQRLSEPTPPAENVVASFYDKNITKEELKEFVSLEKAKENQHTICETHGFDHSQCDLSEECETHPIDSLEGYQQMIQMMAVEQIIKNWADAKGITQRDDVQHGLTDLLSDANVSQLITQIHETEITPESIPKWEVQQYYDNNKETYNGKTFNEVEAEIRDILVQQKDEEYFPEYIEKLKESAGLEVNFELLKVTAPTEKEITRYYDDNRENYIINPSAEIQEIRINSKESEKMMNEAVTKLGSGESFEQVAAAYAENGEAVRRTITNSTDGSALERAVFKLSIEEISNPVTNEDGSISIVKLIRLTKEGTKTLSEVRNEILAQLQLNKMDEEYELKKDEALFNVHGRRYTLGDFYREFKELSVTYQGEFSTYDSKKQLVESLIQKELLLEESGDSSTSGENQHDFEELKIQYLSQILHKEEVDQKITEATDEEIQQFYNKKKSSFIEPEKVKISLIWIMKPSGSEEQARKRADEALAQIRGGMDFADAAKQYSEDATAETGGNIEEWFYQEYMTSDMGKAVFALKTDEVSDVIDNNDGFYIIKIREREEEQQKTYEESKDLIKEYLNEEKHMKLESEMDETLLKDAGFIIYNKTLKKLLKENKPN